MKNLVFNATLLAFLCLSGTRLVISQRSGFDVNRIPSSGNRIEDFIPKGWQIKHEEGFENDEYNELATGDLNQDGKEDAAFIMIEPEGEGDPVTVILLKGDDGKFHRAAVSDRLVGGAAFTTFSMTRYPSVDIKRGVLIVGQEYIYEGTSKIQSYTHRFRFDPASGKFILIGDDADFESQSAAMNGLTVSDNYLTGQRLIKKKIVGPKSVGRGDYVKTVETSVQIDKKRTFFEDAEVDNKKLEQYMTAKQR
jgi:hypothetical protein